MSTQPAPDSTRSVTARAATLAAISGPYRDGIRRDLEGIPLANLALASTITAFNVGMTTGPQRLVTRAVDERMGPAVTAEQQAARRRMILAGNATTVAAGVIAQRVVNHARWRGPVAEVARVTAAQLAIGGIASAVAMITDMALGPGTQRDPEGRKAASLGTAALTVALQRRIVRRGAARVTLPRPPRSVTVPVRSGWRTHETELALVD